MSVGLVSWLALAVCVLTAAAPVFHLLSIMVFLAAALAQTFMVRCPRCNGNVGLLIAQTLAPGRLRTHVANCPFCGVSHDAGVKHTL